MENQAQDSKKKKSAPWLLIALGALGLVGICVIGIILLQGVLGGQEPTPTAIAVETVPVATQAPGAADDSWDRIEAAGRMVVGTSADYPPFQFYVDASQIDGYDIALMDEIGRRLGVEIEYRDMAFDGLGPALSQGQIDVAIAAISRTPEREALVDFSNVYLVNVDGVVAREDADIMLASADDLAAYRVGVQRDTVYESGIQTTLIDAGRMSPDNLFAYERASDAVRDLKEQRIDLVVLDAQAGQALVEQGGVKLVARGLNEQYYAIALPKGAAALKAEIDAVITSLYNDGFIASLAERYLGIAQVLPTPTAAPTSTPGPNPSCIDGLRFVEHLEETGGTLTLAPGQAFEKVWRIENSGTCAWDGGYQLVYVDGNSPAARMGGQPTAVQGQVDPGATYDMRVGLVAPLKPGTYRALWQMQNAQGQAFGERLAVRVQVTAGPTATPAPTQTPVAGITFNADRTQIKAGECVNFSWKVDNVKEVYFYKEGDRWQDHGVAGEGSRVECPPETIAYHLRVVKRDNSVDLRQITIQVEPASDAPAITRFTVDPRGQITLGQCVTIRWQVDGDVDQVALTANGGALWEPAPTKGSYQHCPTAAGTVAYALRATGPGGTSQQQYNTSVVAAATATPAPTAAPQDPIIYSFLVNPNQIPAGSCVSIAWNVGGGATYSRILRDGAVILDGAGYEGQEQDCLDTEGSYAYRLEAFNPAGVSTSHEQTVVVAGVPVENPLAFTMWKLEAYAGQSAGSWTPVLAGTEVTIGFLADLTLNGVAGCNSYSGDYVPDGTQLAVGTLNVTSSLCPEPAGIMEQEAAYLALLAQAASYRLQPRQQLVILDASGTELLQFAYFGR